MAKLYLHIGTEKTGTTSIQSFLANNRARLMAENIYIPSFLGKSGNHRQAVFLAQDRSRVTSFLARKGLEQSPDLHFARRDGVLAKLKRKLAVHGDRTWIISSEHFQSRLDEGEIERLRLLLEDLFDDIKIVLYIRHPLDTAISSWSMRSRKMMRGVVRCTLDKPEAFTGICDHRKILANWINVFKLSQMQVRLYQKNEFVNGDLIHDFCDAVGVKIDEEMNMPEKRNTALNYFTMKVLARAKFMLEEGGREWSLSRWKTLISLAEQYLNGFPSYLPCRAEAEAFDEFYGDSMRWVHQAFFSHRTSLWGEGVPLVRDDDDPRFQPTFTPEEESIWRMFTALWIKELDGGTGAAEAGKL